MTKEDLQDAQNLLYAALAEPIGLLVRTNDRERARQRLYRARREAGDEALAGLQIRVSPFPDGDLVICKSTAQIAPREHQDAILKLLGGD